MSLCLLRFTITYRILTRETSDGAAGCKLLVFHPQGYHYSKDLLDLLLYSRLFYKREHESILFVIHCVVWEDYKWQAVPHYHSQARGAQESQTGTKTK